MRESLSYDEIAVVGDSISDIGMMQLGKYRFFIEPKNNINCDIENSVVLNNIIELKNIIIEINGIFREIY